jgi:uncharacterized protein (DUF433 family)
MQGRGVSMSGTDIHRDQFKQRIVRDSQICGGEPVFKGTRVTLRTVLASLAGGDSPEDVLVQAAIAFAAASAEEDLPVPAVPDIR